MQDAAGPGGLWDWRSLLGGTRTFGGLSAHQEWGQPQLQLWLCQGALFSGKTWAPEPQHWDMDRTA